MISTSARSLPGILNLAPAEFDFAFRTTQERLFLFGCGRGWNVPSHQLLRLVDQHAGGLAGCFVLEDFASERRRRLGRDPCNSQSRAVHDGRVPIGPGQEDRIFRGHFVEIR